MSLLNVGTRALMTNQVALQTTGHNIANVSTAGYSRQSVHLMTVQGQFTGGGYIGQGVDVQTILRNQDELLTRQAALASSASVADKVRVQRLTQLQEVFSGGKSGLGAAITDMTNALGDVVSSPTDLTARTVALTRIGELAGRLRASAERIDDIQLTVVAQLKNNAVQINSLAKSIAAVNDQIASAHGNGQSPNDMLDKRDQLIRDLNQYIQTTQVAADDGSLNLFVAGSQPLVLGTSATELSVGDAAQFPGSGQMRLFFNRPGSPPLELNDNLLGGGEIAGLLRFANNDLAEGRNLLGRMAMAIGMNMNAQQRLGLTLDGQSGNDLFKLPTSMPGYSSGVSTGSVTFEQPTQFAASDYEVRFTTPPAGQVVRMSDGKSTPFSNLSDPALQNIDGLAFHLTSAGNAGEQLLFKPFTNAASSIEALVYSPRDLAAATPINAAMGTSNAGTLQLGSLKATGTPAPTLPPMGTGVVLSFNGTGGFTVAGATGTPVDVSTTPPTPLAGPPYSYTSGQAINIDGWQITLQGTPKNGDTVTVGNALDPQYGDAYARNAGNASALQALRDVRMFDNATMQDGFASVMAQVGTRTQSAQFAANLSETIANGLERDRSAVSGVNLDEEAARLIQYQQAYQASAKMLQIAQTIFDNLLQTVSR